MWILAFLISCTYNESEITFNLDEVQVIENRYPPILHSVMFREGFKANKYICPSGIVTQGFGDTHNITDKPKTIEQAQKELIILLNKYYDYINNRWPYLKENQKWAVVSLASNCKWKSVFNSKFAKDLDNHKTPNFIQFSWYKSKKGWKQSTNLLQSRQFEQALFEGLSDFNWYNPIEKKIVFTNIPEIKHWYKINQR